MLVKLRYVTRRIDRSGSVRWYWQRRGHKLARLPDNPIERVAMAERLNAAADNLAPVEIERGTIGWVIQRYRDSDEYQALAAGTLKYYRRFLREIEALGPALPFASFTRRAVVDLLNPMRRGINAGKRPPSYRTFSSSLNITGSSRPTKRRDCGSKQTSRGIGYGAMAK